MTKLKSCPFCGGKAHLFDYGGDHSLVACSVCCVRTHEDTAGEAVAVWNRRAIVCPHCGSSDIRDGLEDGTFICRDCFKDWGGERLIDGIDLKPCPFCGASAVEIRREYGYTITCTSCGCETPETSRKVAVMLWNRRVSE